VADPALGGAVYPILYLDALVIKIRDGQAIKNFSCYLAIGVNTDGEREVLGMWFQRTEGAKFWLQVLTKLKQRGVQDVLVCCVDGLTGFPDAIEAVYPQTWVQTCIVHQIRSSLRFVPYKDKKKVASDLRKIYTAVDRDHAEAELESFAETWDGKYPIDLRQLDRALGANRAVPGVPPRRAPGRLHDEHDRGALNRQIRKIIKTRGSFPTRTQPASCSTSRSQTPNATGGTPTTGAQRSSPSGFTSATGSPTPQSNTHTFTHNTVTDIIHPTALTQKVGRPRRGTKSDARVTALLRFWLLHRQLRDEFIFAWIGYGGRPLIRPGLAPCYRFALEAFGYVQVTRVDRHRCRLHERTRHYYRHVIRPFGWHSCNHRLIHMRGTGIRKRCRNNNDEYQEDGAHKQQPPTNAKPATNKYLGLSREHSTPSPVP
jgi:Transposase, Mutator family